jgi:ANTAR domain
MSSPALPRHRTRSNGLRAPLGSHDVDVPAAVHADADRVRALETEVAQLRTAMASRAVIEQAKGVLMLLTGCADQVAFDLLTHMSSHTHRKVRDIASELVGSATGRCPLPDDVKAILRDACPPSHPMN